MSPTVPVLVYSRCLNHCKRLEYVVCQGICGAGTIREIGTRLHKSPVTAKWRSEKVIGWLSSISRHLATRAASIHRRFLLDNHRMPQLGSIAQRRGREQVVISG
jgi:hypothetical protein